MHWFIATAEAALSPGVAEAQSFVGQVNDIILFPLISLLMAVAFLYFIFGGFQYILHADDSKAREEGRKHMLWSILGMFVMVVAFAILALAANTFGLQDELECADDPTAANCTGTTFYDNDLFSS